MPSQQPFVSPQCPSVDIRAFRCCLLSLDERQQLLIRINTLDANKHLVVPMLLLVTEAILHAMLTLVRRPDQEGVRRRPFDRKRGDSLLFGNLFNMSCDDDTRMKEMMNDSEYLYESLIGDIYVPGQVLGRNYRLLLQNYILFMYEIILCP